MAKTIYRNLGVATVDQSGRPIEVLAGVTAGPPGPIGPMGPQGFRGLQGIRGTQGLVGPTGAAGAGKWEILDPTDGELSVQLAAAHGGAGMAAGDRYWLLPGNWLVNTADVALGTDNVVIAGSRAAILQINTGLRIDVVGDHVYIIGITVEDVDAVGGAASLIQFAGEYGLIDDIELRTGGAAVGRTHGIYMATAGMSAIRNSYLHPVLTDGGGAVVCLSGATTLPVWIQENYIAVPAAAYTGRVYAIAADVVGSHAGTMITHNAISLGNANYICGVRPANRWLISGNKFLATPGVTNACGVDISIFATEHVRIEANDFTVPTVGVELRTTFLLYISVSGNHFYGADNASTHGVYLSTGAADSLAISGANVFESLGYGVRLAPSVSSERISVVGNTFRDMGAYAIHASVGGVATWALAITGNTIYDTTVHAIYLTGAGLHLFTVAGNTIYTTASHAVYVSGATTAYGSITGNTCYNARIYVTGSNYLVVSGNIIVANGVSITFVSSTYFSCIGNVCHDSGGTDSLDIDTISDHYTVEGNVFQEGYTIVDASDATHLYDVITGGAGDPLNVVS